MVWNKYRLEDLSISIQTGPFGSQLHQTDYSDSGTPVIMPKDMVGGKIVTNDIARVADLHVQRLKRHKVDVGDIIYSRRGDVGRCSLITENEIGWLCGTGCLKVSLDKTKVIPSFLFYILQRKDSVGWVENHAVGATMPNLNTGILSKLPVNIPPLKVQRRIASILSAYDNLIENNTRRIRLLEQMAENLYKEWFVRFRFPGHENAEFENGLPKGWKVKRYSEEINIRYGKGLETSKLTKAGYPVFGSNGQIGFYTKYMYKEPQILISCRGASSGIVNISLPYSYVTSNSLVCELSEKTDCSFEYLKYYFKNTNLVQYQTGSAQPQITINNIEKLKLLVPSIDIQKQFSRVVKIIDAEILNIQHQVKNLTSQRDLLLPRLMSGKLEVKE